MKLTKVVRDSAIIIAMTCAMFVSAELILRAVFPDKVELSNAPLAYEFNADYLVSLKPNVTKEFVGKAGNGGKLTHWSTNAERFRGPELQQSPARRVIVYGDSNIQARFTEDEATYPVRLAYYLNHSGVTDVEVINAGVIGFGPDQILIRLMEEVDRYKPDLVIFHVFADNDFGDILRNRLFNLDKDGNLVSSTDVKTLDPLLAEDRDSLKAHLLNLLIVKAMKRAVSLAFRMHEPTDQTRDELVNRLQELVEEEYLVFKRSQPRKFSHFADHYDIDLALDPDGESAMVKRTLMAGILEKASTLAHDKGIELLVLIQPSVVDMTKENHTLNYNYLKKYPGYNPRNLSDAVADICRANNIDSVNLFDLFSANHPENLFFRDGDDHWTEQGQDLAAKETARYLIDHSMIH